jgi:hypothetical protein
MRVLDHTNVTVSTTTANGVVKQATNNRATVMLVSTVAVYWNSGESTVTATTADRYLPANIPLAVELPLKHDNIGAIEPAGGSGGTLTIYRVA